MARFLLTKPHCLNTTRGPAQIEAGTEISSTDYAGFICTIHMTPLDAEAEQMLVTEINRLLATGTSLEYGEIPGVGPIQTLPNVPTPNVKGG